MAAWAQTLILFATLFFMFYSNRKTITLVEKQITNLQTEIKASVHQGLYDKLINVYFKYIDHPELKNIFSSLDSIDAQQTKEQFMIFALLDLLYFMYINRNILDKGLDATWKSWAKKIFEEEKIKEIFEAVKSEYDSSYVQYIEGEFQRRIKKAGVV